MKTELLSAHMKAAFNYSEISHCERKKVGCVIVKENRIISIGYNGTPSGWENCCEERIYVTANYDPLVSVAELEDEYPFEDDDGNRYKTKTKPETLHAEANALTKLAKSNESGNNASVFVTCSPCVDCAKLIAQTGITKVYYAEEYKSGLSTEKGMTGIEFLAKCNIPTIYLPIK